MGSMIPSIDEWIEAQKPRHDPVGQIHALGLEDDLKRGREAGLSWAKLAEWLRLHGVHTTETTVKRVVDG